jgi:hypothetical protein
MSPKGCPEGESDLKRAAPKVAQNAGNGPVPVRS